MEITKKLKDVYIKQGISAAQEEKEKSMDTANAEEIFNSINDYILDGMPCDRVNEVIRSEEDIVEWKRRICVHKQIWSEEEGDVGYFYKLRSIWIKAFVNEINSDFEYIVEADNDNTQIIKRK